MKKWWVEAVGYQIYIKSFYDANNDGIGDIQGITAKLDYLHLLGINLIWITPFYDSPMDDNGYDVRNYTKISKEYGTLEDFKELIKKAHDLGIKVILDFVLNHTSDEHPWFMESRKSLENPYRDYYIWRSPKIVNGIKKEPTNWGSFFGGSAWKYDELTDQYYMKIFSDKMPDLNWENEKVQKEMVNIGKWWLDLGVDGFRIDAVSHLDKAPFEDSKLSQDIVLDWFKFSNLPKVHTYLQYLNENLFTPYNAFTIGEVGGEAGLDEAIKYASFNSKELSMVFNFDHNWCNNIHDITDLKDIKVNVVNLKNALNKWQVNFNDKGWLPLNWLNHDHPRLVSHYGHIDYHDESAKMLATLMYLSKGTPFIYQGEEIGMTNYNFTSPTDFNDISTINTYNYLVSKEPNKASEILKKVSLTSRDNPRTIMQWSKNTNAGFSKVKPWFHINSNYTSINVNDQINDKDSIFSHYQKLISLRRYSKYKDLILYGSYELIEKEHPTLFVYKRKYNEDTLLVINSFSDSNINYDIGNLEIEDICIHNYKKLDLKNNMIKLKPFESIALKVKEKK